MINLVVNIYILTMILLFLESLSFDLALLDLEFRGVSYT